MRGLKTRFVGAGVLASLAISLAAALGADAEFARDTFLTGAERWGLWAALCIGMTLVAVCSLIWLVHYTITRLQECLDDNTLAFLHFAHVLPTRKCLHDSDVIVNEKSLEDDTGPLGVTARRVIQRRQDRKDKREE
jgi:hypothetical protein